MRRSPSSGERLLHIAAAAGAAALGFVARAYLRAPLLIVLALSLAAAGLQSTRGPFWTLPSAFLSASAAAGGIVLINSVADLSGFVGPYVIGLLRGASGTFHSGLPLLALVPLAGAALALRLRRAPVLATVPRTVPADADRLGARG